MIFPLSNGDPLFASAPIYRTPIPDVSLPDCVPLEVLLRVTDLSC